MPYDEDGNRINNEEAINTLPQISVEVGVQKFFLRELLLFFRKKRKKAFGDAGFSFTVNEFKIFLMENREILRIMGPNATNKNILQHLILCKSLLKRDINGEILHPTKPAPLLTFLKKSRSDIIKFEIKNCTTSDLTNAIRDLDVALCVHDWSIGGEERTKRSQKSLFHETGDYEVYFRDNREKTCHLSLKEMPLFRTLTKRFREPCESSILYKAWQNARNLVEHTTPQPKEEDPNEGVSVGERRDRIESGIAQLRQKLYELSGNPDTIRISEGRISQYTLIY